MSAKPSLTTAYQRILLVAASMVVALLVAEAGYRMVLSSRLQSNLSRPSFRAVSGSLYEFDAEFGYRYVPGATATSVEIVNGVPTRGVTATVNRAGGLGPEPDGTSPVDILAFGDSFTSNPLQPVAWPEVVSRAPEFNVLNCARDGYGVLQMMHLAAAKNRELRPDLIIVAFITEDLLRDRFWRSTVERNGRTSIFVSARPEPNPDHTTAVELALVDPDITPQWLNALPTEPEDDPVFHRLCDRYRGTANGFYAAHLRGPSRSLLLNRIRFGDPWHGLYPPARNPRTSLTDFAEDPEFMKDFRSIQVPMAFVLLPKYEELLAGMHFVDPQAQKLLSSLETLTGVPAIRLMDTMDRSGGNLEALYLLPEDQHPSPEGAQAFGEAMLRMLRQRVQIRDSGSR